MFGQKVSGYDYNVLNEREVRASAGIMFLFGILSFFWFILTKDIKLAELFAISFLIEFVMRLFLDTRYAPYMILGKLIVINQKPEWVEASPKKFAWYFGLILGVKNMYIKK